MRLWKRIAPYSDGAALWYVGIALVALLPRVADLGTFITHDEAEFWIARSESLLRALQTGDFSSVDVSTHPGVTTMWLGAAGIALRRFLFEHGVLHQETFQSILALQRLPVALAHTLGILLGYALLRRMLSPATATLAALLWATDPFVVGYSRLLHVDALAGTCATLSLLAACRFWTGTDHTPPHRWLVLSGICAALAALSKTPALALIPVVAVLALSHGCAHQGTAYRRVVRSLIVWCGVSVITILLLWPSIWAAPVKVYQSLRAGVEVEGAQPHMTGNFFLGKEDPAPGPLFYPVALALRTTPWTLAGLLLLPFAFMRPRHPSIPASPATLRDSAALAGYIILVVIGLSLFPKKFNRYMVLAFPAVDILAAVGLVWLARVGAVALGSWNRHHLQRFCTPAVCALVAVLALVNVAWYHPYTIVAFNQVLGGPQAGAHTFAVGWGEGLEQVADWLNQQPDSAHVLTISHMITSLSPYLRGGARATFPDEGRLKQGAGYVVVYIYQVQGGHPPPPFDQFYPARVPLHTVVIHGVAYAWVYRAPPPVAHEVGAGFGDTIRLYGYDGYDELDRAQPGQTVRFRLVWETRAHPATDYWLFAYLVDPEGHRLAQVDLPYPTSTWVPGTFETTEVPITLPTDMAEGDYHVEMGLYDMTDGQRLTLTAPLQHMAVTGENDVLMLTTISR